MNMYLQHYFDPDFDYQDLRPDADSAGSDRYNLGYAQNVVKGQIIAEMVPLDTVENPIPQYVLQSHILPQGPNTRVDPKYPQYLFADANGYVFYYGDKIAVKHMLNLRNNVDFRTGNIFFVGDAKVYKDVKAGFSIQANNVEVVGLVEGGEVRARQNIKVLGGARGGSSKRCLLDSRGNLRVTFAEKVELRSKNKTIIDKSCIHSQLYVAGNLIINDKLVGGVCQVAKNVLVKGDVGNRAGVNTSIYLGYDPHAIRRVRQFEKRIDALVERITHYQAVVGHLPPEANELTRKLQDARKKHQMLLTLRDAILDQEMAEEEHAEACRLIVLGTVYPGVDISIGQAYYTVQDKMHGVIFQRREDEIINSQIPTETLSTYPFAS